MNHSAVILDRPSLLNPNSESTVQEILFIDATVMDYPTLVAGVKPGIDVAVIDSGEDGIAQMTAALAQRRNIEAIHIVAHGAPGRVFIGQSILCAETLPHYTAQLESWRSFLVDRAEILIYSCWTGLGEAGDALIDGLAEATRTHVAASTNLTGSSTLGGDWGFGKSTGNIQTSLGFVPQVLENYPGTLAIFNVTNGNDSGDGSLRQAILDANGVAGADEIRFSGVTSIDLTSAELQITDELTITGETTNVTVERNAGAGDFRIFNVTGGVATTFDNLTITNGNTTDRGGGIQSNGEVNLIDSTVSGNYSGDRGGGVYTPRAITLTESIVSGNESNQYGGGLATRAQITVTNSTVSDNFSRRNGAGLYSRSGNITLTNSTVSGNESNRHGGGVWARSRTITLTNSTVSGNSSRLSAAGMYSQTANIVDSVVSNNSSGDLGGGVYATGTTNITNSTISGNSSTNKGGGIYFRNNLTLTSSTISGNSSNRGGGFYSRGGGTVNLTNSTISGNSSRDRGGGIFARGRTGGTIEIFNSTIANNTAENDGGGIFRNAGTINLTNAIVANNIADRSGNDLSGTFNTIENSLIGDTEGATIAIGTNNLTGVDPQLLPLGNYGGDTQTHALVSASPAINASGAGATVDDQRGIAAFGTRDIGAFEAIPEIDITGNSITIPDGDTTPDTADGTDFGSTAVSEGTVVRTFTIANQGNINLTLNGSPLISISGTNADDFSVTALPTATVAAGGNTTFQVTFDPSATGTRNATVSIANNDNNENPYTFEIHGTGIDATAPTFTSITRNTPAADLTDADTLIFRITFDEAVQNVDAADFQVNGITSVTVTEVSSVSASEYDITVSGGDLANFNGIVGLDLATGQDIADLAGNALPNREPSTDETYTVVNATSPDTTDEPTVSEPLPDVRLILDQLEVRLPDFPATGICGNNDDDLLLGDEHANALCGLGGDDTLAGFGESDRLDGNDGNDIIFGNTGNDTIDGGAGDDLIFAGKDDDLVTGGDGIDEVMGDIGNDTVDGNAGNDVLFGNTGTDVLDGDDGDDLLFGGVDNDIVTGGAGNDVVRGDLGDDLLIGGAGGDRFDFRPGDGNDIIADFTDGVDIIGLLDGLTFADVTLTQVGNDTQITATGLVVTLQGVNAGAIDSTDFAAL